MSSDRWVNKVPVGGYGRCQFSARKATPSGKRLSVWYLNCVSSCFDIRTWNTCLYLLCIILFRFIILFAQENITSFDWRKLKIISVLWLLICEYCSFNDHVTLSNNTVYVLDRYLFDKKIVPIYQNFNL